ncbi:HalOD1 output domain-containing protein [Halomontanus rarus]|uniref:HalOD1 output domain-containing protein n=1 Tax=Halomontanus rarus TaxID=3034020 RepID=UPI001A9A1783|nr:HalOD1 output domain-containing protein [Halovivax sp. TS33]
MKEGGDRVDGSFQMPLSQVVVRAVADAENVPAAELTPPEYEPLYHVVDPAALDELFEPMHGGLSRRRGTVTFPFCGYTVTVSSDGDVTLE